MENLLGGETRGVASVLKLTFLERIKGLDLASSQLSACLCLNEETVLFSFVFLFKIELVLIGEGLFLFLEECAVAELGRFIMARRP